MILDSPEWWDADALNAVLEYEGGYLLVGGRKPYTIWNPIYCKDSWRDYPLP